MIDVFDEIYLRILETIREEYPSAFITDEYVRVTPSFPHISIQEINNTNYLFSQDCDSVENHILLGIQIDIYTIGTQKKLIAKEIFKLVDNLLIGLKFNRILKEKMTNVDDDNIHRLVLRYEAVIGKDNIIYSEY